MRLILFNFIFLVLYVSVGVLSTSVDSKWPQYIFHPRFQTALESLKKRVQGEKNELWQVLEKIQKIEFLREIFKMKVETLTKHLENIKMEPYECTEPGATFYKANEMCYLLVTTKKTWKDARQDCLIRGGDLSQPSFADSDLHNLIAQVIGSYNMAVYLGATSSVDTTGTITYKFLDGLNILETYYNHPTPPLSNAIKVRTLTGHLDRVTPTPSLYLLESSAEDLNAFVCEFSATLKPFELNLKEVLDKELFDDYLPNENDVEMDMPLVQCVSETQFAIGTKCYEFFDTCVTCEVGTMMCKENGGSLAHVDLSPKSRFGGVLADIIRISQRDAGPVIYFPIWIKGEEDGSERFLQDHNSSRLFNDLCSVPSPELKTRPKPMPEPQCIILLVPEPTPEIVSDNDVWDVLSTKEQVELPYLCQYEAKHKIWK